MYISQAGPPKCKERLLLSNPNDSLKKTQQGEYILFQTVFRSQSLKFFWQPSCWHKASNLCNCYCIKEIRTSSDTFWLSTNCFNDCVLLSLTTILVTKYFIIIYKWKLTLITSFKMYEICSSVILLFLASNFEANSIAVPPSQGFKQKKNIITKINTE